MKGLIRLGVVMFAVMVGPARAQDFGGGTGTDADPYLVATATHLDNVRSHLGAHFRQTADIDLGVAPWNEGEGWVPLGASAGSSFSGRYDGGGFTIDGLTINRPSAAYQGLFGYVGGGGHIHRLRLVGANLRTDANSGGLVGRVDGMAVVEHIAVQGQITSAGTHVGGMAGYVYGVIHRCSADVTVNAGTYAGGLIGYFNNGEVLASFSVGSVTGATHAGGLAGYHRGGTLTDCYSHAAVAGTSQLGGLVGYQEISDARLFRCHSTGAVTGGTTEVGGLVGRAAGITVACCWDTESSGRTNSAAGAPRTTAQMQQQANYPMHNFHTLWSLDEGHAYPVFQDPGGHSSDPTPVALADLAGTGLPGDPYIITTPSELHAIRQGLTNHFRLVADLDLSDSVVWDYGRGWQAIGALGATFRGRFDGGGHTISNLTLNRPRVNYQGLFGYTQNADIRNLRVERLNMQGQQHCGGLGGHMEGGVIDNVAIQGQVLSSGSDTGGLVGWFSGRMQRAAAQVSVELTFNGNCGGLVGYNAGEIRTSFSAGTVRGPNYVGGLVGHNNAGQVYDCHSHAAVHGASEIGGMIGRQLGTAARLDRSHSVGAVSGTGSYVGGLVGRWGGGLVTFACWDTETSGQAASDGGTGRTTAQMLQPTNYPSYNFDALWTIDDGHGYPSFRELSALDASPLPAVALAELDGSGTPADPYVITTPAELHALRQGLTNHFRLATNLDLSHSLVWDMGRGWDPVGKPATPFTGGFDGGGHVITGLTIGRPDLIEQGMFGALHGAQVRGVHLRRAHVRGNQTSGGLAGRATASVVEDVTVQAQVVSAQSEVGGLIGAQVSGTVARASAEARVEAGGSAGGLVGYCAGEIRMSYATGRVSGTTPVGGLVGWAAGGVLLDCYSHADVAATSTGGGLLGTLQDNSGIHRCYSTGAVTGSGSTLRGLLGFFSSGTVNASYWDTETSGRSTSPRGEGRTTAQMTEPHEVATTYVGWDFDAVWARDADGRNRGYPCIRGVAAGYVVAARAEPADGGQTDGDGVYTPRATAQLAATAAAGHAFVNWTEDGTEVSTQAVYTFTVTADRGLVANFARHRYLLAYAHGAGGTLAGATNQTVAYGDSGTAVMAVPDDGAVFRRWSDGVGDNSRTDTNVQAALAVTAQFRTVGNADPDWYADYGFSPAEGQSWGDLDRYVLPAKGTTLLGEYIADTDPHDTQSVFRVVGINLGPPLIVHFQPGSTTRLYTLEYTADLGGGAWTSDAARPPRLGAGGTDGMPDTNAVPIRFYRVRVGLP